MIKYHFLSSNGEFFINLPKSVTDTTMLAIMRDCGFSKCYVLINGVKLFKDFQS